MINKKISTIAGSLIILAIAIVLGWSFFAREEKEVQNQNNVVLDNLNLENKEGIKKEEKIFRKDSIEENKILTNNGIYENIQYGYKINISENFIVNKGPIQDQDSLIRIFPKTDRTYLFSIYVSKSKFKDVNSWLDDYEQNLSKINSYEGVKIKTPTITLKEKTNINGISAIKITLDNMPFSNYLIVFIKDNLIYEFSYNGFIASQEELEVAKDQPKSENNLLQEYQLKHRQELEKIFNSLEFTK